MRNNPILYTDPTGHLICLDGVQCYDGGSTLPILTGGPTPSNNNNNDDGDVNWSEVINSLLDEAQSIRNDYWLDLKESLISKGISSGFGAAVGWMIKCPAQLKAYCTIAGFFAGLAGSTYVEGQVAMLMESDASAYERTASLLLQGMDDRGQVGLSAVYQAELTVGLGVDSPYMLHHDITLPEHYVLSVNGADNTVNLLPHQYEFLQILIQNYTGP